MSLIWSNSALNIFSGNVVAKVKLSPGLTIFLLLPELDADFFKNVYLLTIHSSLILNLKYLLLLC